MTSSSPINIFLHNIEVQGNPKIEKELEKMVAKLYCEKIMDSNGTKKKTDEVIVSIKERIIRVKVHNSWQYL